MTQASEPSRTVTEYRVKVTLAHDIKAGAKAGEEFFPRMVENTRENVEPALNWWKSQGHEAVIEERTVLTVYGPWVG